jgi:type I restriction enzyme, S subunit
MFKVGSQLPEGWAWKPLDSIAILDNESLGSDTPSSFSFSYIDISSVTTGRVSIPSENISFRDAPSRARKRVKFGDILMSTVRPNLQAFAIFSEPGNNFVASTGFAVLTPREDNNVGFIYNSLLADYVRLQIENNITGTNYPAIACSKVPTLHIATPTSDEQSTIATILDTIDNAIQHTEAMIEKLQRVKAGLLHDLLTCGLDENGELRDPIRHPEQFKDSPLGRIPKGWEIESLHQFTDFISYGFTNPMPSASDGSWMITAFDVGDGKINYSKARHTTKCAYETMITSKSKPMLGDILVTKDGTLGRVAVVDQSNICINQSVAVLRPSQGVDAEYIARYLRSPHGQAAMLADAGGSAIKHIYITKLAEQLIPYPLQEERQLIKFGLQTIDDNIRSEMSLLLKFKRTKQGLMRDLLTGIVQVPKNML